MDIPERIAAWMAAPDNDEKLAVALEIAGEIDIGSTDILPVLIRGLGPYLTDEATLLEVQNALELLAQITYLQETPTIRDQLRLLVAYLDRRLLESDRIPSFRAGFKQIGTILWQLITKNEENFHENDAPAICMALFFTAEFDLFRREVASTRLRFFEVVEILFDRYMDIIKIDLKAKFISGLASLAAFEKEPSCLRAIFRLYEKIGQRWNPDKEECETMFNSFARYFPITIRTLSPDPAVPSSEELKALLKKCWTSNSGYAPLSFPKLIELLDSNNDLRADTKIDVFSTIAACVSGYSYAVLDDWIPKVWDALKWEVWNGENPEFVEAALGVLSEISRKLSGEIWAVEDNVMARHIQSISKDCVVRSEDRSSTISSGRILGTMASSSPYAFTLVLKETLQELIHAEQNEIDIPRKAARIEVLNIVLQANIHATDAAASELTRHQSGSVWYSYLSSTLTKMRDDFKLFLDSIWQVYSNAMVQATNASLEETTSRLVTIKGLELLLDIPDFLSDSQRSTAINQLCESALSSTADASIREVAIQSLSAVSMRDPDRFQTVILPTFMDILPPRLAEESVETSKIEAILEALKNITCTGLCMVELSGGRPQGTETSHKNRLFDSFQGRLLELLDGLTDQLGQQRYIQLILATMYCGIADFDAALEKKDMINAEATDPTINPYNWIVSGLFKLFISQKKRLDATAAGDNSWYIGLRPLANGAEEMNDPSIDLFAKIITLVLRSPRTTLQNNLLFQANEKPGVDVSNVWTLFTTSQNPSVLQENLELGPADKCAVNMLSMALVAGVKREDKTRLKIQVGATAAAMIRNSCSIQNQASEMSLYGMLSFLQLLVNKFGAAREPLSNDANNLFDLMGTLVVDAPLKSNKEFVRIHLTLAHFTAAALACSDPATDNLIKLMLKSIDDSPHGKIVAKSFRILLGPSEIMTKANFCILREMRYARLYALAVPELQTIWTEDLKSAKRENCMIALLAILEYMPIEILKQNEAEVLKIALCSADIADSKTKVTSIDLIKAIIPVATESVLKAYQDSIITQMANRVYNTYTSPSDSSIKARAKALEVLALLPKYLPEHECLKRRSHVMREVDSALDDCSRTVRQMAQKCKMVWFDLSAAPNGHSSHDGHDH